jgi:hypothetical protein
MRVVPAGHLAWQVVDGQAILLDLAEDLALGLNATGSFLLAHLLGGCNFDATVEAVVVEFDVSEEQARGDIWDLVRELQTRRLVEVVDD